MDDKEKYWFKAKRYGYGWTPVSREGWLVTFIYIGALMYAGFRVERTNDVPSFLMFVCVSTAVLFLIGWKTGERPRWQWGERMRKK